MFNFDFKNMVKTTDEGYLNNIPKEKREEVLTVSDLEGKIKDAQEIKNNILEKNKAKGVEPSEEEKLLILSIDRKIYNYSEEIKKL